MSRKRMDFVKGARPNLPHPHALMVEVWHRWNIDLVGVFKLDGEIVLFNCLDGFEDEHVWFYHYLSPELYEELDQIQDPDELWKRLKHLPQPDAVAYATDEDGIIYWSRND